MKPYIFDRAKMSHMLADAQLYERVPELLPLQSLAATCYRRYVAAAPGSCCGEHIRHMFPALREFMQRLAALSAEGAAGLRQFVAEKSGRPVSELVMHYREVPHGKPTRITVT